MAEENKKKKKGLLGKLFSRRAAEPEKKDAGRAVEGPEDSEAAAAAGEFSPASVLELSVSLPGGEAAPEAARETANGTTAGWKSAPVPEAAIPSETGPGEIVSGDRDFSALVPETPECEVPAPQAPAAPAAAATDDSTAADEVAVAFAAAGADDSVATGRPAPEPGAGSRGGFFSRLRSGLSKTRTRLVGTLDTLFYGKKEIDEEFLEQLEEILLTSDLGVKTSYRLFAAVEEKVSHQELEDPEHLRRFLQSQIEEILQRAEQPLIMDAKPYVIMTVGVNGVGKTTTIGKLAAQFAAAGRRVLLGAADTFRAAAVEQLEIWAERANVPIITQKMGADPAAVCFDSVQAAMSREMDVVIIDTAGRLHTKVNLMDELVKMKRVIGKALPGAPHEILLVLDANTGQNAINQARMFHEALGVTGIVLTKLDGTAKGGVIVGVCDELGVPVRYIGIGEQLDDLRPFRGRDFAHALFDRVTG